MFRRTERLSRSAHVCVRESMGGMMVSVRRDRTLVEWILRRKVTDRVSWWRAGDGVWFHYPSFELVEDATLIRELEEILREDRVGC